MGSSHHWRRKGPSILQERLQGNAFRLHAEEAHGSEHLGQLPLTPPEGDAEQKSAKAAEVQEKIEDFCEDHSVDNVLALNPEPQAEQPKKKVRKPRAKKSAQVVALQ